MMFGMKNLSVGYIKYENFVGRFGLVWLFRLFIFI